MKHHWHPDVFHARNCHNNHGNQDEVDSLMMLCEEGIRSNLEESIKQDIQISVIVDRTRLPESLLKVITEAEEKTRANSRLHLILAIGHGGKKDVLQACKKIGTLFPFPDLLIRTSGEFRLSNLLLYKSAYAELYFTKTLSLDFKEEDFITALKEYQERKRRYGR
ncbi:hypothetical protein POM88_037054 [Heracleum sosnowskyi]|uniref:Alkyl transferase n=1 Tax=Heracleum sosnowskyi TaxID=360622 RepID=A0AAD8HRD4_9APIA|nr:hypothetical protein POM88_037054 [Heracleum sosnowskyi]